jgi:tetratricopeptide (TPR) repeat protein
MRQLVLSLIIVALVAPFHGRAQEAEQLDADVRMFAVMAAINVAGFNDGVGARSDSPVRAAVRARLESFDGPSRELLRNAYEQFKLRDPEENLSQFVTFALLCSDAPVLELYADLPTDLPPDVRPVRSMGPLFAQFYREADIEDLWQEYRPAFEQELARYQAALTPMLLTTTGYLRIGRQTPEFRGFKVWLDLMGAPDTINTRLYDGNVQVVDHSSADIHLDEIRHAFLIHLLDRLSIRNRETIASRQVLSRFALFAPALDDTYKENFELLVTKSLVKAVEARLDHGATDEAKQVVDRALREGFILAPYFYEALERFEAEPRNMNQYYSDMIEAIDVKTEAARLRDITFLDASEVEPERRVEPRRPQLSLLDKKLQQAEFLLREELLEESRTAFLEAIEMSPNGRNAQAEYGLGRVAAQEGEPTLAIEHFLASTTIAQEFPHIRAMSHIYVARISDIMGEREQALEQYNLAQAVGDTTPRTQELIDQGLSDQFQSPRQVAEEAAESAEEEPEQLVEP